MKTIYLVSWLLLISAGDTLIANEAAIAAGKTHLESLMKGEWEPLGKTYPEKVQLMPGHEFLKPEYGLADGRDKMVEVDRDYLLEAMRKASEGRPERPVEKIEAMLETLTYEALETTVGEFRTDPSDPVKTPDGKLNFQIENGDVLLKIAPPKGDFLLFQLRSVDGQWKVVAEYLD